VARKQSIKVNNEAPRNHYLDIPADDSEPVPIEVVNTSELPESFQKMDELFEREGVKPFNSPRDEFNKITSFTLFGKLDGKNVQLSKTLSATTQDPTERVTYYVILRRQMPKRTRVTEYIYTVGVEYPEQVIKFVRKKHENQQDRDESMAKRMRWVNHSFGFGDKDREHIERIVNQALFGKERLKAADG
jgi:hypothetical protein